MIQKVQVRKRRLILCGNWNINFMQDSRRLHDMQELLSLHNLVNTVRSLTSVIATVMDLGYSDHKAQVLRLNVKIVIKNGRLLNQGNILRKG